MTITIKDDPSEFDLYKMLGLDVFVPSISKLLRPVKTIDMESMKMGELREYAKKFGIKGNSKQSIIDAINQKQSE